MLYVFHNSSVALPQVIAASSTRAKALEVLGVLKSIFIRQDKV